MAGFKVYPNPAKSHIYLEADSWKSLNVEKASLHSLDGKLWKTIELSEVDSLEINIRDLKSGIYLLKLEGENGMFVTKFVKE